MRSGSEKPNRGVGYKQPQEVYRELLKCTDLNCSNRPVRTRMPGGVGGARSGILTAPIPILFVPQDNIQAVGYGISCKSEA